MYTDMYNTFDEEPIRYHYPFSFRGNSKLQYMDGWENPDCIIDYGDTFYYTFPIDSEYQDYYINVIIYNFRFEEIYREQHIVDSDGTITFSVDSDMSSELFKRGRYYCRVQAEYKTLYAEDVCTLIRPVDFAIVVR